MTKDKYIKNKLTFTDDERLLEGNKAVMMGWERPLMKRTAEILCCNQGDILNIGFGLGIIDECIQSHNIKSHTIIECHPDVLNKMKEWGWYDKDNVTILEGFWQDHIDSLSEFDAVYFDTWKEQDRDFFQKNVHKIIKKGGVFSFFNASSTNEDKHYLLVNEYEILKEHFSISSDIVEIDYDNHSKEGINQYWDLSLNKISIPVCIRK